VGFLEVVIVGFGLSMDALAVSLACGAVGRGRALRVAVRLALAFGLFQALMPVAGYFAGVQVAGLLRPTDHWIAFGLLLFVGGKMGLEALRPHDAPACPDIWNLRVLLVLAVATSIDALAVGLSLSFLATSIIGPALAIGGITFGVCFLGVLCGARVGGLLGRRAGLVGGLILIGIGVKILVEHVQHSV
jgi:putative Mn2+ efflux pump MntP